MRPRLSMTAANSPVAGRIRLLVVDEVSPYPAGDAADPINLARRAEQARSGAMRLREKGKKDVVTLGWDEAQAVLQAGTHEVADDADDGKAISGEKGPEPDAPVDELDTKTRPELEALAAERGVDITKAKTKADVIEALRAPK